MVGAFIRSRTFWYTTSGIVAGLAAGHVIGGIGMTMRGGAFGVNTEIVLAVAGAIVGYRAGRKAARQPKRATH